MQDDVGGWCVVQRGVACAVAERDRRRVWWRVVRDRSAASDRAGLCEKLRGK